MTTISSPITACLRDGGWDDALLDQIDLLNRIDIETCAHVPSNVAVKRPDTRVVGVVLNDQVSRDDGTVDDARGLQDLHISSLCVLDMSNSTIPLADTFSENVEVVTVKMHRVRGWDLVLHDDANGVVVAEVVDVPLRVVGVRYVAQVCQEQNGVIVVTAEGLAVHLPKYIAAGIGTDGDVDGLSGCGFTGSGEGEEWGSAGKRVVAAVRIIEGSGDCCRGLGGISLVVVDCCDCRGLVGGSTIWREIRSHEDCRGGGQVRFDKNVCALANTESDHVGIVWLHRDEIVRNDSHGVVVDAEALDTLGSGVNQPKTMGLPLSELKLGNTSVRSARYSSGSFRAVVIHLAVDQVIVRSWRRSWRCADDLFDNLEIFGMIPVRKHDGADIDVVRFVLWSVYNHGSGKATSILSTVVRVIPRSSVEISLESIYHGFPRGNWALLHRRNTVVPRSCPLKDTVPMKGSTFLWSGDLVVNSDLEGITPIGFELGSRELVVDQQDALVDSVRSQKAS